MSFQTPIDGWEAIVVRVTNSTVTDIVDCTDGTPRYVSWLSVGEHNGDTPNVTVELYDGTNSIYLDADGYCWNVRAFTAKQAVAFDDIRIDKGWKLRVTSSHASGRLHVKGLVARVKGAGGG